MYKYFSLRLLVTCVTAISPMYSTAEPSNAGTNDRGEVSPETCKQHSEEMRELVSPYIDKNERPSEAELISRMNSQDKEQFKNLRDKLEKCEVFRK